MSINETKPQAPIFEQLKALEQKGNLGNTTDEKVEKLKNGTFAVVYKNCPRIC
jgi:hypothetical protein